MKSTQLHRFSILVLMACCLVAAPTLAGEPPGTAYGEPLTGSEITAIADLLDDPASYVGKIVRVEGTVDDVCQSMGCWMSLTSADSNDSLKIKAEDGVIVFPISAKGSNAVAEGTFTSIEMTLEETIAHERHHAEETGEAFDEASVTEPVKYYQIDVTGAVIE